MGHAARMSPDAGCFRLVPRRPRGGRGLFGVRPGAVMVMSFAYHSRIWAGVSWSLGQHISTSISTADDDQGFDHHRAHLPAAITGHSPVRPPFVCTLMMQTNTTTYSSPSASPVTIQALVVAIQRDGQHRGRHRPLDKARGSRHIPSRPTRSRRLPRVPLQQHSTPSTHRTPAATAPAGTGSDLH
jgi:hypothetical protein